MIVVISRQVGSLGDEIAIEVAKRLSYQLVDQIQVHHLAKACDPEFAKACTLYEKELEPGFFERFFFSNVGYATLFESLNYELASRGNVILIGRGAQIVLKDIPGVFKARIVAPRDVRVKRIAQQQGTTYDEAFDFVNRYDNQRRALIRTLFDQDLKDWDLYDLILNTNNYDLETGSDIICHALELIPKNMDEEAFKEQLARMAFAKKVESKIKKRFPPSPYRNIGVTMKDKEVLTLSGFVSEMTTKETAGEIASKAEGITKVENQIMVTKLST